MRIYNFSAGPAALPTEVLERARDELLDWNGQGVSVMEMSHRGKAFISIAEQAEQDLRELMNIPGNYKVLFLQGGASMQFAMVPMNLRKRGNIADYVVTGLWGKKAVKEASRFVTANRACDMESDRFTGIPEQSTWHLSDGAAFVHYTPNETINGVEFEWIPDTGKIPLVADMSSNILSKPIDVSRYGIIYAGAQKNIGPAGLTVVIIREDLIGDGDDTLPSMMDYQVHAAAGSMSNTPPTYAWYMAGLVFKWIKEQGGVDAMAERNRIKANKLYAVIDASEFYANPVMEHCRSRMNVPFTLVDSGLDGAFLQGAEKAGLSQLKGHRSVGGMRASIYNAMPEQGVDALVEYMSEFERKHG